MEEFKDLDSTVIEAKKMLNTFRAFEKIPKVLKILQTAVGTTKELNGAISGKRVEIANLDEKIGGKNIQLDKMDAKIDGKNVELRELDKTIDIEKDKLLDVMHEELAEIRKKSELLLKDTVIASGLEIKRNIQSVKNSKKEMEKKVSAHRVEIKLYEDREKDAKGCADKALKDFEKIKKSLLGGV